MILTTFHKNSLIVVVTDSGSNATDTHGTMAVYSIEPSYSTDAVVVRPKLTHKKQLREFTDRLNERDRKRRWRK